MDFIEELKSYLRVDKDCPKEQTQEIEGFKLAAEEALSDIGVEKNYESELYKLAVKLQVAEWNSNRVVNVIGSHAARLSHSLTFITTQLRYRNKKEGVKN